MFPICMAPPPAPLARALVPQGKAMAPPEKGDGAAGEANGDSKSKAHKHKKSKKNKKKRSKKSKKDTDKEDNKKG